MKIASYISKCLILGVLAASMIGCSHQATIYRYGAPSLNAEIVASDPNTLVVKDKFGEAYEVPTRTVTSIDHPGSGWIYAGVIIAAIGAIPALALDDDAGAIVGGTYIGLGAAIGLIGGLPYIQSSMNASGADLRSGVKLVPGTDMPVRRINEGRMPKGPERRK